MYGILQKSALYILFMSLRKTKMSLTRKTYIWDIIYLAKKILTHSLKS